MTAARIGYAHPSLSRDEVERLDRLRDEAGDRASAELVERALFDGDEDALAALGFHAVEVEPGDEATITTIPAFDEESARALTAYWRERGYLPPSSDAAARAEREIREEIAEAASSLDFSPTIPGTSAPSRK